MVFLCKAGFQEGFLRLAALPEQKALKFAQLLSAAHCRHGDMQLLGKVFLGVSMNAITPCKGMCEEARQGEICPATLHDCPAADRLVGELPEH